MPHHFPCVKRRENARSATRSDLIEPQERLARLVGLDDQKSRLSKILGLLVNPQGLERWATKFHSGEAKPLLDVVLRRPPLVVLAGDVGSGKTELAETIGDAVARQRFVAGRDGGRRHLKGAVGE